MEVKSALWQKLFILPISLSFCAIGVAGVVSPYIPSWHISHTTQQVTPVTTSEYAMATSVGVFLFVFGFALGWAVFKYSIKVDDEGISQTNGFFKQSVRWVDVDTYYVENNRRFPSERHLHAEPVMLDSHGTIVFQGFGHILFSSQKIIQQRKVLWQFAEEHLAGKRVDAPVSNLDINTMALKSLDVNWSEKSAGWKAARMLALACYTLFWLGCLAGPMYYIAVHNLQPPGWVAIIFPLTVIGPAIPHLVWLEFEKRRIRKDQKDRKTSP